MSESQKFETTLNHGEIWEAQFDDVTLRGRWIEHPDPDAPIIHFVHGNGFACDMYAPSLNLLRPYASIFTHDVQGHGLSDPGSKFPGLDKTVARIGQVLKQHESVFKNRPIIGVGHSFGSLATLHLAAQEPALFASVALLDPVLLGPEGTQLAQQQFDNGERGPEFGRRLATQALMRGTEWASYDGAFAYFNGRKSLAGWHSAGLAAYLNGVLKQQADGSLSLRCPPWMEASIFALRPADHWSALERLATPTLAVFAKQSFDFIPKSLQHAAELNSAITATGTAGGHCFTQEYPASLLELLLAFPPTEKLLNATS